MIDSKPAQQMSLWAVFKNLLLAPLDSPRQWGLVLVIALAFIAMPQFPFGNDWTRNAAGLVDGLDIYTNPSYVYPPWSLVLLWPYYWMTAAGSRVASVLVIGWLSANNKWNVLRFLAIVLSPYFLWTMFYSNIDVLALVFPVLLWGLAHGKRWQNPGRGIALAILLIKPQVGVAVGLYLLWQQRRLIKDLFAVLITTSLLVLPVCFLGSPPLVLQWLENTITNPSSENQLYWVINNVSSTSALGWLPGILLVGVLFGGLYYVLHVRLKLWTENHTLASLFLLPMLLGPYASNQSMIAPLAFVFSLPAVALQYLFSFGADYFDLYEPYNYAWALLFVAMFFGLFNRQPVTAAEFSDDPQGS